MPAWDAPGVRPIRHPVNLPTQTTLRESEVVVVDGVPASLSALRWIAHRSTRGLIRVRLVTVVDRRWVEMYGDKLLRAADEAPDGCSTYLTDLAPNIDVSSQLSWGVPRDEIALASIGADLLIIGSNRTHTPSHALGGLLPVRLVEVTCRPVVVVPEDWTPTRGDIVVGVQGDDSDEAALHFAATACLAEHRALRLVHARSFPVWLAHGPSALRDLNRSVEHAERVIHKTEASQRELFPDIVVTSSGGRGDAAEVLQRQVQEAALLVVGAHGSAVLDPFFVGSVSRELLTRLACPLAFIRPGVDVVATA